MSYPKATLKNGLTVANFADPYEYRFDDGTVLKACSQIRSDELTPRAHEIEKVRRFPNGTSIVEVSQGFLYPAGVEVALTSVCSDPSVDIVLCYPRILELVVGDARFNTKCRGALSVAGLYYSSSRFRLP